MINEAAARRAKENMSFSSYKEGSATSEYNQLCIEANEKAAKYSDNPKAEAAAEQYKIRMGNWMNKYNSNGANHVSWMISGPANYNMKKHNKCMDREGNLWKEYEEINNKFDSAMRGVAKPVIKSSDSNALEALQEKLEKAEAEHKAYKDHNKKAKKEGTQKLAAYVLANSNGRIRAIKQRIIKVEKAQTQEERRLDFDGGYVIENKEAGRTQIMFEEKPNEEMRTKMKSSGWKWSPRAGAWQRQLTANAWSAANRLLV